MLSRSATHEPSHIPSLLYQMSDSFYLWQIGPALKHCEVPNYYGQHRRYELNTKVRFKHLTLYFIMLKNGQIYFKDLAV